MIIGSLKIHSPTMVSHLDHIGLAFLGVYLLFFVCIGSLSHRIRFIGTNARSTSGWSWISNYYSLLIALLMSGLVLFLILQGYNIAVLDTCAADSVLLYRNISLKLVWKYARTLAGVVVAFLCAHLVYLRRAGSSRGGASRGGASRGGSRRNHFNGAAAAAAAQWSFDVNWEAVCQVCLFHIGCRTTYFLCVFFKAFLKDNLCYPVGTQSNSVSFDAQFAAFWLLTIVRLPVALGSSRRSPNSMDSYSLATYVLRLCQGYSSLSELIFVLATFLFLVLQIIIIIYFDYGQGRHSLRQIIYGFALGIAGHGLSSANVDLLFAHTPEANLPTSRHQRIHKMVRLRGFLKLRLSLSLF